MVTGWLIIGQAYDPGWSARVVGKTWPLRESHDKIVLPGDGGLIAIPIRADEPGELQLDYRPVAWRRGTMITPAAAPSSSCCWAFLWCRSEQMNYRVPPL